jgi:hypothetical protein
MNQASPLEVRTLGSEDLPAIQSLFKDVFNQDLSEAFHAWKYRSGQSGAVGVFRAGKLVAHYAGVGTDILLQGKPARALQIVDVMVSVEARQSVRANSPFFLAASNFLQSYIGFEQPYLLGYGFPSERHLKLAQHLKLYAPVGGMTELNIEFSEAKKISDLRFQWRELDQVNWSQYMTQIEEIWKEMQSSLLSGIVVRRDAKRIAYRYLQHPQQHYHLFLMESRLTGKPSALVVLKREAERLLLMDIVAPIKKVQNTLRLTAELVNRQFSLPLFAWFSSSYAAQIAPTTARLSALPIRTPANVWTDGPKPAELMNRWWLTAGDTDFL